MNFSLDSENIAALQEFEKVTRTNCKDTFKYKDRRVFIVAQGGILKALGKNNSNIEKLEKKFGSKVKLVEFNDDVCKFIVNFLKPLKISSIELKDDIIFIEGNDNKTQGLIIGAKAQNLRNLEEIIRKYFPITEIKVGKNGEEI